MTVDHSTPIPWVPKYALEFDKQFRRRQRCWNHRILNVVTEVSVTCFDSEAMELTYKDLHGRVANQLLSRQMDPVERSWKLGDPGIVTVMEYSCCRFPNKAQERRAMFLRWCFQCSG